MTVTFGDFFLAKINTFVAVNSSLVCVEDAVHKCNTIITSGYTARWPPPGNYRLQIITKNKAFSLVKCI